MPFKYKKDRLAYQKKWRHKHPGYMRAYGRRYYALGKIKPVAPVVTK